MKSTIADIQAGQQPNSSAEADVTTSCPPFGKRPVSCSCHQSETVEEKLVYPRLPPELDRRRVLTEREIAEMKELRQQGYTSRRLAEMYAVSKTIVLYHTNDEAYREKVNKKRYERIKQREKSEPKYKEFRKEGKREGSKSVLKRNDAGKKYKGKMTYKWKKKKLQSDADYKKRTNQQAINSYHKNKTKKQCTIPPASLQAKTTI